jgi:hypothetical protein
VHDDRLLVEARLERAMRQFVRPARYAARVPLVLTVWHVPGEPVPVDQALQAAYEPFTTGTVWGKPWSTSWFRLAAQVPDEWAGRRVEAVIDPGFTATGPASRRRDCCTTRQACPSKEFTRTTATSRSPPRPREASRYICSSRRPPTRPSCTASSLRIRATS